MKHIATFALLAIFSVPQSFSQTPTQTDSETLQAILVEMRGIHNDVRLSQTTQILLTELQVQHGVVDKAMERRDSARGKVSQMQMNERNFAAQIAQDEDNAKSTMDPAQQKRLTDQEANLKTALASLKGQEDDAANAVEDAENALRKEQETLSGIQAQLDEVVKKLQPVER
jgi:Zn-dependent peptidase ImmA (M78 family)